MWYQQAKINSYASMESFFSKARSKSKGRPLNSAYRVFQSGEDYVIQHMGWSDNRELCRLSPDNTLTLTIDYEKFLSSSQSLTTALHRAIPIAFNRIGKGRYRVESTRTLENVRETAEHKNAGWNVMWEHMNKDAPEFFTGIQFNFLTGECLNRRPDHTDTVIPEKRKEWLRAIKKFKRGMKTRIKVGAIEGHIAAIKDTNYLYTRWAVPENLDLLYVSIRDNEFSEELLKKVVMTVPQWRLRSIDVDYLMRIFENICTNESIPLRRKFGVFEKQVDVTK